MSAEHRCPACYELVDVHEVLDRLACPECPTTWRQMCRVRRAEIDRDKPADEPRYPVDP